jgi:hypothetical protein
MGHPIWGVDGLAGSGFVFDYAGTGFVLILRLRTKPGEADGDRTRRRERLAAVAGGVGTREGGGVQPPAHLGGSPRRVGGRGAAVNQG